MTCQRWAVDRCHCDDNPCEIFDFTDPFDVNQFQRWTFYDDPWPTATDKIDISNGRLNFDHGDDPNLEVLVARTLQDVCSLQDPATLRVTLEVGPPKPNGDWIYARAGQAWLCVPRGQNNLPLGHAVIVATGDAPNTARITPAPWGTIEQQNALVIPYTPDGSPKIRVGMDLVFRHRAPGARVYEYSAYYFPSSESPVLIRNATQPYPGISPGYAFRDWRFLIISRQFTTSWYPTASTRKQSMDNFTFEWIDQE